MPQIVRTVWAGLDRRPHSRLRSLDAGAMPAAPRNEPKTEFELRKPFYKHFSSCIIADFADIFLLAYEFFPWFDSNLNKALDFPFQQKWILKITYLFVNGEKCEHHPAEFLFPNPSVLVEAVLANASLIGHSITPASASHSFFCPNHHWRVSIGNALLARILIQQIRRF